jgi:hypothetical protein
MVFTESVRKHTRRRVLGLAAAGVGGAALAGCEMFDEAASPRSAPPAPDALQPLLTEAVALAGQYDRAVAAQPGLATRLSALAADHRAHATALARLIGQAVPAAGTAPMAEAGATTTTALGTLAQLRTAERTAQRTAVAACTTAPAGRAALVGSIAACRATHVEALR